MYLREKFVVILSCIFISSIGLAMPPVEFLQSCKNSKPANDSITMTLLDGFGTTNDNEPGCRNHFDSEINAQIYGAVVCDDQPYLIIANKKISTATAKNYSMNPSVKPDIPILRFSDWWRINKGDKSYLCIQTSLSDTASAANSWQYYLVEDAFDVNKKNYNISYYFFDKNVYKRF
ncbi:hypothetical protein Lwal_3236 [Legionella waltersii]|uniref:Uncharacterized protein n=2 Tax=Legionella waltersii TaxID=66969 RepID=A0A0W1A1H4_9GAMM|nr:hypothetical protein Lwal_3236 [Legionella waltersii]SNV10421.1 Uncharacterised protein [Legionella waltersii]